MKIIDAIRNAAAAEAVYFLLTSYLESFWAHEQRESLHPMLRALPIAGKDDVIRRSRFLELHRAHESPVLAEARDIFRAAVERLDAPPAASGPNLTVRHSGAALNNHVTR